MKNSILIPTLLLAPLFHSVSYAKIPQSDQFFEFSLMEESELNQLLHHRNAKGESVVKHRRAAVSGNQSDLWSLLDSIDDKIEGTSTAKAYANPDAPAAKKEIIVAVIDGGVDINHEDLKGKIWANEAELNGVPGVDDDANGYIDDSYGWNFLGNAKGVNIDGTTLEITREYARLKSKKANGGLTEAEAVYFAKISTEFQSTLQDLQSELRTYEKLISAFNLLKKHGLKEETVEAVDAIQSTDPDVVAAQKLAKLVLMSPELGSTEAVQDVIKDLKVSIQYQYNPRFDSSTIVGDNPRVMDDIGYGNPDVIGPDAHHGTHVAGIIAAQRENNTGIIGQADNVKIMAVRAVPNGDERDKDVANAIRYAVDNGAHVINMSFGKPYSPNKSYVDEAVAYAESKGVLLVHAAGNDGKSTETGANNFPNKRIDQNKVTEHEATNWIEVGASGRAKGENLPAYFSNYGKTSVDLFAPGVRIVSTIPGNQYAAFNGTSMASPETAGVAAFLWSRFPEKSAREIVSAMMSTTTQYPGLVVNLPAKGSARGTVKISFTQLSKSGGIVNASTAMMKLLQK